ncbi:hypothetical protein RJD14_33715 [Streptomyces sp. CGMCC 4.1456]|nr:hypothetical protein [Streptomyces sp. CGMCC 4.1456]WNF67223.1 hypothetical protein RJD14_33715 [Streptomyces sp. CGMCC 4.1456]
MGHAPKASWSSRPPVSWAALAALLTVGSTSVATSMFPRYASGALDGDQQGIRFAGIASLLHRICRCYAVAGLAMPALGIATGAWMGVLSDTWLIASLALTVIAAAILALAILPGRQRLLALAQNVPAQEEARPWGPA